MRCDEVLELLSASLDGEITPAQQAQLDEHLAQCPACRALQTELLGMEEALGSLEVSAPAGLKEQILDNLPPQAGRKKPLHWQRWCAMAACAALVVLGVWQLPRSVLSPAKDAVPTDAPAMDTAPAAAMTETAILDDSDAGVDALNDEAVLPPYVEGDGVNVNAAPTAQPDPESHASYTSFDAADTPEAAAASTEDAAPEAASADPTAPHRYDLSARSAKTADQAQTNDAPVTGGVAPQAAPIPAAGAENGASAPSGAAYSGEERALNLPVAAPVPEPAPEATQETAITADGTEAPQQPMMSSTKMAVTTSQAPDQAADGVVEPIQIQSFMIRYCGILTVDQYEPADLDYSVELSENGQRQYVLLAADFQALVEQLDSQGRAYELATEGEGIDPEAQCGLVVVIEQAQEPFAETPTEGPTQLPAETRTDTP